jgi:large conductance mechanosensitive channel
LNLFTQLFFVVESTSLTAPFANGRITLQEILSLEVSPLRKEFRDFVMRGNVLDLAIAVILGAAFGAIITSLVNDILMPLIGVAMGGVDFTSLTYQVGEAVIAYGKFIQAIINFLVIAFVLFLIIRSINRFRKIEPAPAPTTKECPQCFTAIPIQATRCPNCTSQI